MLLRYRTGHRWRKRNAHPRRRRLRRFVDDVVAGAAVLDRAAGRVNRCDDPARYSRRRLFGTVGIVRRVADVGFGFGTFRWTEAVPVDGRRYRSTAADCSLIIVESRVGQIQGLVHLGQPPHGR